MFKPFLFIAAILWVTSANALDVVTTLQLLSSEDYEERTEARNQLRLGFAEAEGDSYEAFEQAVLDYSQGTLPLEERLYLLKLIGLFGTEASVAPVAAMLAHENVNIRDSARRALSSIPEDAAARALALGLRKASSEDKPLFFDALAYRKEPRAVAIIAAELKNPKLSRHAAVALGKIGSVDAIPSLLNGVQEGVEDVLEFEVALLRIGVDAQLARRLVEKGSQESICVDAFRQLSQQDSKGAGEVLGSLLKDPSARARSAIISEVWLLDVPELKLLLVEYLPKANLTDRILIITGVGAAGASEFEKDLLALFPMEENAMLKQVMYDALGSIGGDGSFEQLFDAFQSDRKDRGIADSLARLQAPSADAKAMKQALSGDTLEEQLSAIRVLELRNVPGSTGLVNTIVKSSEEVKLRQAAMKTMESIGDLESIEILMDLILSRDALLRPAQRSLKRMSVNFLAPDFLWEHYFQPAFSKAETDEQRIGLIRILDCVDSAGSIDYMNLLIIESNNEAMRKAAVKTLSRWPTIRSVDVWMQLLKEDSTYRSEAIRAIHRAVSSESVSDRPSEKVEALVGAVASTEDVQLKNDLLRVYLDPPSEIIGAIESGLAPLSEDPDVTELVQEIIDALNN